MPVPFNAEQASVPHQNSLFGNYSFPNENYPVHKFTGKVVPIVISKAIQSDFLLFQNRHDEMASFVTVVT